MKTVRILLCLGLIALMPATLQAEKAKEMLYRKSIPLAKAKEVKTNISFFAGKLIIDTSTNRLSECYYGYTDEYIEPYVHYSETNDEGTLTIKCKKSEDDINVNEKDDNKWKLELNKNVKNDMYVEMMAGEADINLPGANLSRFELKMMAGEAHINLKNSSVPKVRCKIMAGESHIDLTGEWKNDCDAEISGGVGETHVKVPSNVGVKVHVSGLLGESKLPGFNRDGRTYTNDAWGKTKHEIVLYISGAIGQITVTMD